ncbi:hypothetical protein PRZ48_012126 [Zasmidium cellare]|uniref:Uncharacterized protein n=1 Tax=Zasmidium cellare TaxID=395010 RepID=A0ABR0E418_ZASCE|nr:hypothetical protein PRZ48_012126 [Zasmidium cellare]
MKVLGGEKAECLGRAIVTALLLREEATVIAAVRDPDHETAKSLQGLPKRQTAHLIVVKIDAASHTDHASAVKQLQDQCGIKSIDVVIANAGIIKTTPLVRESTIEGLLEHYHVNAISTVMLYQATRPLLLEAHNPRFIVTSGSGGSIAQQDKIQFPLAEYGPSRAAVNWLFRKVHFEEERIAAVLVDPGLIDTETGGSAVTQFGMHRSNLQSVEQSAENYLKVVDSASKENTSGKFISAQSQTELEW